MDELAIDRRRKARPVPPATSAANSSRRLLWGPDDLLRWVFALLAGAIVIGVAWYLCAGDVTLRQQVGPTDVAVAGLLLTGLGNATWLLRGRRAVGERRRALLPDPLTPVRRVRLTPAGETGETLGAEARSSDNEVFLAGPGMERFHRPTCSLAAGRSGWTTMTRDEQMAAGRKPCGVCQP